MANERSGSCACGTVRYALLAPPMFTNCCHCLDCQRQTGSAFAINAIIEASKVELLAGAPVAVPVPTDSGRPHDIYRCPDCQTALWSDYGRRGWVYFVRVGTLDAPHAIFPDAHIFTRSKVPWINLSGALSLGSATGRPALVCEVYVDVAKDWPPESLARRDAAAAKR